MANGWAIPETIVYLIWNQTFPRVLADHWLHDDEQRLDDPAYLRSALKAAMDRDVEDLKGELGSHLKKGHTQLPDAMYLGLDAELEFDFRLDDNGLRLPRPSKPKDTELIFTAYARVEGDEVAIPGLMPAPHVASPLDHQAADEAAKQEKAAKQEQEAAKSKANGEQPKENTWQIDGNQLAHLKLWLPKTIALLWLTKGTDYDALQSKVNKGDEDAMGEFRAALSQQLHQDNIAENVRGVVSQLNEEMKLPEVKQFEPKQFVISHEGVWVPDLPDYPAKGNDVKKLYASWADGDGAIPTFSHSGYICHT